MKRIAFGYRSFYNFKNRILIMNNLILTKKVMQIIIYLHHLWANLSKPRQLTNNLKRALADTKALFRYNYILNYVFNYSLTAPIVTPVMKYFWQNG